jgi:hypothetical protein
MYTFMTYSLERVPVLAKTNHELKDVEPFKTVLSGNREAMAELTTADLEKILGTTQVTRSRGVRESASFCRRSGAAHFKKACPVG